MHYSLALNRSNIDVFRCRIENDSSVDRENYLNLKNHDGKTALAIACENARFELVQILLQFPFNQQDLMPMNSAIRANHQSIVQLLLDRGISMSLTNQFGQTAAHLACQLNRVEILTMLIDRHQNLECQDHLGQTLLLTAVVHNHRPCVEILLNNGANFTATDLSRRTISKFQSINEFQLFFFSI